MANLGEFKSSSAPEWSADLWDRLIDAIDGRLGPLEEQLDVQKATADAIVRRGLAVIEELLAPQVTEAGELVGDIGDIKTDAEAIKAAIQAILDAYEAAHLSADLVDETAGRQFLTTTTRGQITTQLTDAIAAAIAAEVIARNSAVSAEATARDGAITAAINALKAGVDPAYDTLVEIAAKLAADDTALANLLAAVGNRVRIDADGGYTLAQRRQARGNILAGGLSGATGLVFDPFFEISQQVANVAQNPANGVIAYASDVGHGYFSASSFGMSFQNISDPASGVADWKRLLASYRATVSTGKAMASGEESCPLRVIVEGRDFDPLGWGTDAAQDVDVVAVLRTNWTGTVLFTFRNRDASRTYVHAANVVAGLVTPIMFTVPGDTTGAWRKGIDGALYATVGLVGVTAANVAPALDSWQAGNKPYHGSGTQWQATSGNYLEVLYFNVFPKGILPWSTASQITGDALHALLSMRESFTIREQRAKRYWHRLQAGRQESGSSIHGQYVSADVPYPVTPRTTPNVLRNYDVRVLNLLVNPFAEDVTLSGFKATTQINGTGGYTFSTVFEVNARM